MSNLVKPEKLTELRGMELEGAVELSMLFGELLDALRRKTCNQIDSTTAVLADPGT
jgi:hypothetical protein